METQKCVLYDRDCIGCLECEMCDLDPNKVCDNCGKCLNIQDFATIKTETLRSPVKRPVDIRWNCLRPRATGKPWKPL